MLEVGTGGGRADPLLVCLLPRSPRIGVCLANQLTIDRLGLFLANLKQILQENCSFQIQYSCQSVKKKTILFRINIRHTMNASNTQHATCDMK